MALFNNNNRRISLYDEDEDGVFEPITAMPAQQENTQEAAPVVSTPSVLQMRVVRPKKLSEVTEIADNLKKGQTIVLNLDDLSDVNARRTLDYIAGVIYAVNGKIERPSDRTFLLTPKGVNVDTEEN